MKTELLRNNYINLYNSKVNIDWLKFAAEYEKNAPVATVHDKAISTAAVHSLILEGHDVNVVNYFKSNLSVQDTKNRSHLEFEDLVRAYQYAGSAGINFITAMRVHSYLSRHLIPDLKSQGVVRNKEASIFEQGIRVYSGAPAHSVLLLTKTLFDEIEIMVKREIPSPGVFYYASMIHLLLLKILPFADGNGHMARLAEKWFLAKKLGPGAWHIPSERFYAMHKAGYGKNLDLGHDFEHTDFDRCMPFLLMLPAALSTVTAREV